MHDIRKTQHREGQERIQKAAGPMHGAIGCRKCLVGTSTCYQCEECQRREIETFSVCYMRLAQCPRPSAHGSHSRHRWARFPDATSAWGSRPLVHWGPRSGKVKVRRENT